MEGAGHIMRDAGPPPDVSAVLSTLKDFQQRTVEYVFRRLYQDPDVTRRFLVADEVGLGKTLVARGIIARTIEYLWDKVDRIDVVYICSNADIARQNVERLRPNLEGVENFPLPTRLTLLPTAIHNLQNRKVNLISLTPGTSFDLKSSMGTVEERALLYWLLKDAWGLTDGTGPLNVLQGPAGRGSFRWRVRWTRQERRIDSSLAASFKAALDRHVGKQVAAGELDIRTRFLELCRRFARSRQNLPWKDRVDRARIIGELRALLAATCIEALEPDLVIMDEFQRFRHLLSGDDDASRLARALFEFEDEEVGDAGGTRILMLSATPYKMYTRFEESEDDHYSDFVSTVNFLLRGDEAERMRLTDTLSRYRGELFQLGGDLESALSRLSATRAALESILRKVMVRTERLASSKYRGGMLVDVPPNALPEPAELLGYVRLQEIAGALGHHDVMEYWKAAPYLLSFMDDYQLKRLFTAALGGDRHADIRRKLRRNRHELLFPWQEWREYSAVDPANARLRSLQADMVESGAWRLTWMPPTLPHYALSGPFADAGVRNLTKRLVFSAWRVVPKVIATLLSYDAERRMMVSLEEGIQNNTDDRTRHRPLLRLAVSEGRSTGMPVLGLMYPSSVLARECDPLELSGIASAAEGGQWPPTLQAVRQAASERIEALLAQIPVDTAAGPPDEAWYWAAPILLDWHIDGARDWFARSNLASIWSSGTDSGEDGDGEDSNWKDHVNEARRLAEGTLHLSGPPPSDLAQVLTDLALAGPGVCAYRALSRIAPETAASGQGLGLRDAASSVGWAFRRLFNLPEVMALIRSLDNRPPYWRRVLEYCADGGLQAVLDEYAHVLKEALGLSTSAPPDVVSGVSAAMQEAISLKAVTLRADEISPGRKQHTQRRGMRARFALRYGDERSEDEKSLTRSGHVRGAFNSPFWPFVLATTSIGQEGLDFHQYCHAVVHWDLPSNPVDLEQREGRIHRYKGHAVRKNLATAFGKEVLTATALDAPSSGPGGDPWERVFNRGIESRAPSQDDIVPFWVFTTEGGARIERHVPAIPLSRDAARLTNLKRSLALYRMVFGQPRQEDLMEYLLHHLDQESADAFSAQLRIDLSPRRAGEDPPERPLAGPSYLPRSSVSDRSGNG